MKIIDENNNVLEEASVDRENGYLTRDTITIEHPAIEAVAERWHYEYKEYPNGGKDRIRVVDVPGVEGREAFTETEDVMRYIAYTDETRPEPVPTTPTPQDDTDSMLVDHEYRLTLLELGLTE